MPLPFFRRRVFAKSNAKSFAGHKEEALAFVHAHIKYFNEIYGFDFAKVAVKNQKTRWGSCSKKET